MSITSDLLVLPTFNAERSFFSIIVPLGIGGGERTEQAENNRLQEIKEPKIIFLLVFCLN